MLFRDGGGRIALLEDRCPHRGIPLSYGFVEDSALVWPYQGWTFDGAGRCRAMPAEPQDSPLRQRVCVQAYRVGELGGLVWAYLGPEPAPLLPHFDLFVWDHCLRDIGQATHPCHWLQIMENSVDPRHVEALHGHHLRAARSRQGLNPPSHYLRRHQWATFDRFEFGILKRLQLEGQPDVCDDWTIGHPLIFPHMLRVGSGEQHRMQIRVPVDETTTRHLWYRCYKYQQENNVCEQQEIPIYDVPRLNENGLYIMDTVDGQDIMTWVT